MGAKLTLVKIVINQISIFKQNQDPGFFISTHPRTWLEGCPQQIVILLLFLSFAGSVCATLQSMLVDCQINPATEVDTEAAVVLANFDCYQQLL